MLEKLRCLDLDKSNIIRCHETFSRRGHSFMVFEMLDLSVFDYIIQSGKSTLPLNGIKTIIRDVATALKALKGMGLIHTDLKLDNIMLVDHKRQPFRVKVIDFGLTLEKTEVKRGLNVQPLWYRSPEVILGHRFTGAIDIWSLGNIMAEMLLGFTPFPGKHAYDVLRYIINLLGEPPKRLLNGGMSTKLFYKKSHRCYFFTYWKFKRPEEYFMETGIKPMELRRPRFFSLDQLKILDKENTADADERSDCVELLKKMLQVDPRKRITPNKILVDPFITLTHVRPYKNCGPLDVKNKITDSLRATDGRDVISDPKAFMRDYDTASDSSVEMDSITKTIKARLPVKASDSNFSQGSLCSPDAPDPKKKKRKKGIW
ncbi:homeodomain-interacting protein kinase 1-like isoform X2 [Notolabrus celidotus]|nr:homeodomain-interacting protein kinase 1-like isoform X2 [Notolabrus celidotus]